MDRKYLLILFVSIFFLGVVVLLALEHIGTVQHEDVHRQIQVYFGCQNNSVKISFWGTSYTACLDDNRTVSSEEWGLHAYNEIVSYNNTQIVLSIFFCTIMLITFIYCLYAYNDIDKD